MAAFLNAIKGWAKNIKRDVVAIWLAARDPRVPWYVKAIAGAVAAYALSPIDLIPDFIPVIGYLDDIVVVPLGILIVVRLIEPDLMSEFRSDAARHLDKPRSIGGLITIVCIWIALTTVLFLLFRPYLSLLIDSHLSSGN